MIKIKIKKVVNSFLFTNICLYLCIIIKTKIMKTLESLKGIYFNCAKENAIFIYKGKYFGKGNRENIEIVGVNPIFINKNIAYSSQHNERGGFYGRIEIPMNEIEII